MGEGERSKSGLQAKLKVFQGRSDTLPPGQPVCPENSDNAAVGAEEDRPSERD